MHACRDSLPEMLYAVLSRLYIIRGYSVTLVMSYIAVCYAFVDGEPIVSTSYEPNCYTITIDCLQTMQRNSPVQQLNMADISPEQLFTCKLGG